MIQGRNPVVADLSAIFRPASRMAEMKPSGVSPALSTGRHRLLISRNGTWHRQASRCRLSGELGACRSNRRVQGAFQTHRNSGHYSDRLLEPIRVIAGCRGHFRPIAIPAITRTGSEAPTVGQPKPAAFRPADPEVHAAVSWRQPPFGDPHLPVVWQNVARQYTPAGGGMSIEF